MHLSGHPTFLLCRFSFLSKLVLSFFFSFIFKFTNIYCCRSQPSAVEPSRKSPLAESCLLAILLHMSTTCTVCGPSRQPLEAPSGLNSTLHSPYVAAYYISDHIVYSWALFIFPIHKALAFLFSFFCSGIHHLYRLLCNQSQPRLLLADGWVAAGWVEIPLKACRFKATSKYLPVNSVFDMYVFPSASIFGIWPSEALCISVMCRLSVQVVLQRPLTRQHIKKERKYFSPSICLSLQLWSSSSGSGSKWQEQYGMSYNPYLRSLPAYFFFIIII